METPATVSGASFPACSWLVRLVSWSVRAMALAPGSASHMPASQLWIPVSPKLPEMSGRGSRGRFLQRWTSVVRRRAREPMKKKGHLKKKLRRKLEAKVGPVHPGERTVIVCVGDKCAARDENRATLAE